VGKVATRGAEGARCVPSRRSVKRACDAVGTPLHDVLCKSPNNTFLGAIRFVFIFGDFPKKPRWVMDETLFFLTVSH